MGWRQWWLPRDSHLNCHQSKVADILTDSSAIDIYTVYVYINVIKSNRNSNNFSQEPKGSRVEGRETREAVCTFCLAHFKGIVAI